MSCGSWTRAKATILTLLLSFRQGHTSYVPGMCDMELYIKILHLNLYNLCYRFCLFTDCHVKPASPGTCQSGASTKWLPGSHHCHVIAVFLAGQLARICLPLSRTHLQHHCELKHCYYCFHVSLYVHSYWKRSRGIFVDLVSGRSMCLLRVSLN